MHGGDRLISTGLTPLSTHTLESMLAIDNCQTVILIPVGSFFDKQHAHKQIVDRVAPDGDSNAA